MLSVAQCLSSHWDKMHFLKSTNLSQQQEKLQFLVILHRSPLCLNLYLLLAFSWYPCYDETVLKALCTCPELGVTIQYLIWSIFWGEKGMDALARINSTSLSILWNANIALWPVTSRWQLSSGKHSFALFLSLLSWPHWPPTIDRNEQVFSIILKKLEPVFVFSVH